MGSQKQIALLNIVKDPQLSRHVNELMGKKLVGVVLDDLYSSFFLGDPADTVVAVIDGTNDCSLAVFGISANLCARVVVEQSMS